jgi:hypothetical protein
MLPASLSAKARVISRVAGAAQRQVFGLMGRIDALFAPDRLY